MTETIKYKQLTYATASEPLTLKEKSFDVSSLQPNEVFIKVHAAALNPVDLILHNTYKYIGFIKKHEKGYGRDYSGEIVAVGLNVKTFKKNDKVYGMITEVFSEAGTIGEYFKLDITKNPNIAIKPENISFNDAASIPLVFGTAMTTFANMKKQLSSDSNVLIIGGGTSVATFAIQLLKEHYKVKNVVTINSSSTTPWVKSIGADYVIEYNKVSKVGEAAEKLVQNELNNEKFDLIFDTVGDEEIYQVSDKLLKPVSQNSEYLTCVGSAIGDYNSSMFSLIFKWNNIKRTLPFLRKNINFKFVQLTACHLDLANELIEKNQLKTRIDSVFQLNDFADAIKKISDHKAKGKVIIEA